MLFKAPRSAQLPHLETMLNALGNDELVAKFLGVTVRTIQKYRKEGQAPRPVMLALFWETPWGVSQLECEATNQARMAYTKARILERENEVLRGQLLQMEKELQSSSYGAANGPIYNVRGM